MAARRRRAKAPRAGGRSSKSGPSRTRLALGIVGIAIIAIAGFWLTLPDPAPLRSRFPESTALIEARALEARGKGRAARRQQRLEPLGQISPWLQRAVVDSEDARFYQHGALDLIEAQEVLARALEQGKLGRGASTLTQQLAKNLWLGEERSLWRKGREAAMAWELESLGKERILELYLNVVEWGDGIYGAEAAAQHWFGVRARDLSPEQAAILAAMLPAPRKRNPRHPSARLKARAAEVLELFGVYKQLDAGALAAARERLRVLLGG